MDSNPQPSQIGSPTQPTNNITPAIVLSPHLAQVINQQYIAPVANTHVAPNTPNILPTTTHKQSRTERTVGTSTTSIDEEEEAFQTEFGDELSFLVENFGVQERKDTFMPYIC